MRIIPFSAQWTLQQDEIKAIKGYHRLNSTYVQTSAGISYCLRLYPNGNHDQNDKVAVVHLGVNLGNARNVVASYTFKVDSAKHQTEKFRHIFERSKATGDRLCYTRDLYDTAQKFFVNGKMILKVDGVFEIEDGNDESGDDENGEVEPKNFGNLLWKSYKEFSLFADEATKEIKVHKFMLAAQSKLFARSLKNENKNQHDFRGYRSDEVKLGMEVIYGCKEYFHCSKFLKKFLDYLEVPAFKDISKWHTNAHGEIYNPYYHTLGAELWEIHSSKDVTIMVEGREINAHKAVLAANSSTFATMFKETKGNKIEITRFPFDVVELAIKEIYIREPDNCSFDDAVSMLTFFHEYDVPSLKELYEARLIPEICNENVCIMMNYAIETYSWNLKEKCMDFLMLAFAQKTPLPDIHVLDKDVASKIFQNTLSQLVSTTSTTTEQDRSSVRH